MKLKLTSLRETLYQSPVLPSLLILIIILTVNAILQPKFFSYTAFKNNILSFTPLCLIGIGQAIILITGDVDLSLGASVSFMTVVASSIMQDSVTSILLAILVVFIYALVLGLFNGFLISYMRLPALVLTFATSSILFGLALVIRPSPGGYIPKAFYKLYRADVFGIFPAPLFILLFALFLWYVLSKHKIVKYIYAVGGNAKAAGASGIDVLLTRLIAFSLSSVFIALAGICVVAQTATGDARSGLSLTMNSVAASVIGGISLMGGRGNILGALVGGLIIGFLINIIFFARLGSFYQEFTKGLIIILCIAVGHIFREKKNSIQ